MTLEVFFDSYDFVIEVLNKQGNLGEIISYEESATKTLIIAAAGEHEKQITRILKNMSIVHKAPDFIGDFISTQALKRRYHSLFDWNGRKITSFAGLFGSEKRIEILAECQDKPCVDDFFYIGSERNRIVHNGLASESIDITFNNVRKKYYSSLEFLEILKKTLH